MMTIELKISPRKGALLLGHDNQLDVLIRAVGPQPPAGVLPRKSLNLALVIDKSGSMSGQPLQEAKRCAAAIVDRLGPGDFISVVAYDDHADVVWPARPVTSAAEIKQAIAGINEGGSTALHDGWASGAEQAALNHLKAGLSRVLLLSDGGANFGLTDPRAIASHCAQIAERGVSTSTYGLGSHFNEELMLGMARQGGGNAYYGQTAADLMGPFQEEFDLLRALYARDLRLALKVPPGVTLQVANDFPHIDGVTTLPDLAYASEAWALVRLTIDRGRIDAAADSPIAFLEASLRYRVDDLQHVAGPETLALPSLPAAAFSAVAEDETVARRAQEVRFAEFQREAAGAARDGNWFEVDRVLDEARREAEGNEWLTAAMPALEAYARRRDREQFAKEAAFKSQKMMSRLSIVDELRHYSLADELERPSFLRRKMEEGKAVPEDDPFSRT